MSKFKADFENLQGISTEKAMKTFQLWWRTNLSDARNLPAQELAKYFVEYHSNLIGKPNLTGIIEYSATTANQQAINLMRKTTGRNKVIMSNLIHEPSLAKACEDFGMNVIRVYALPEKDYQVPEEAILEAVEKNGIENIAGIVSTYGTTQLGHIEQIANYKSVQEMRNQGVWLHVDSAFGGVFSSYSDHIKTTLPEADSFTLDPYKLIGMQGVALLLGEKGKINDVDVFYYNHSPFTRVTSLSAGSLSVWCETLRDLGEWGVSVIANECIANSRRFGRDLTNKGIPLVINPFLNIIPINTGSPENREQLRNDLYNEGFSVGRVGIKGENYQTYGIRIVCSPRDNHFSWSYLNNIAESVEAFLGKRQ